MSASAQKKLKDLFRDLKATNLPGDSAQSIPFIDHLAITSLSILGILLDDKAVVNVIANRLSLILGLDLLADQETALLGSFKAVEKSLEEHLRGFSAMFQWVLEEVHIRKDAGAVLSQLDNLDPKLLSNFTYLSRLLSAYLDLDEAFSHGSKVALVVLFLLGFRRIAQEFIDTEGEEEGLYAWLLERVKDQKTLVIYRTHLANPQSLADPTKASILVVLCEKIAQGAQVSLDEKEVLDEALKSVGMIGLAPLLSGGFLNVVEPKPDALGIRLVK